MSRSFSNNIANYLTAAFTQASDQDWSIACYFKATSDVNGCCLSIADSGLPSEPRVAIRYGIPGSNLRVLFELGNAVNNMDSSGDVTEDVWWLAVVTFAASDGDTNVYNNSTTPDNFTYSGTIATGDITRLMVGGIGDSTPSTPWDGLVAQVAIWTHELSSSEVSSLFSATTTAQFGAVQSANLVCHYPLNGSNLSDRTGNLSDLSVTGTVSSDADDPLTEESSTTVLTDTLAVGDGSPIQ